MATLVYKSIEICKSSNQKIYFLTSITDDESNVLKFKICGAECAFLNLGDKKYKLTDGEVSIKTLEIADGYNSPKIIEGTKIFFSSAFIKDGKEIKSAAYLGSECLMINELLYDLSLRLKDALSRIKHLEEKTEPHELFIFTNERTIK